MCRLSPFDVRPPAVQDERYRRLRVTFLSIRVQSGRRLFCSFLEYPLNGFVFSQKNPHTQTHTQNVNMQKNDVNGHIELARTYILSKMQWSGATDVCPRPLSWPGSLDQGCFGWGEKNVFMFAHKKNPTHRPSEALWNMCRPAVVPKITEVMLPVNAFSSRCVRRFCSGCFFHLLPYVGVFLQ